MAQAQFQREAVGSLWAEVWPLLCIHWREIATWHDIELDPNLEAYEQLEEIGALRVFTARIGDELVGYAAYVVRPHLHYQGSTQAVQDVLFIAPEHRRGRVGIGLIAHADAELAKEGVQVVFQHVKCAHDFGALLERLGYSQVEKVYAKRID